MRQFQDWPTADDLYLPAQDLYIKYKHLSNAERAQLQGRIMSIRARLRKKEALEKQRKKKEEKELEEYIVKVTEEQIEKQITEIFKDLFKKN